MSAENTDMLCEGVECNKLFIIDDNTQMGMDSLVIQIISP